MTMNGDDSNARYDAVRCRTCGCEWATHPTDSTCAMYRPRTLPTWVADGAKQLQDAVDADLRKVAASVVATNGKGA